MKNIENLLFLFNTTNLYSTLAKKLGESRADLIIIDAFTDNYRGEMNSATQIRIHLHRYKLLADKNECTFIFLHHIRKSAADQSPSKHNVLGSTGIENKSRSVLFLSLDKGDENARYLSVVKHNYMARADKSMSYVLSFDENLIFSQSGERMLTESIGTSVEAEGKQTAREKARSLKAMGLTLDKITEAMSSSGFAFSRSWYGKETKGVESMAQPMTEEEFRESEEEE